MSKPTMSEQEARAKLAEVTAALEKQVAKGKTQFSGQIDRLNERLKDLAAEIASLEAKRDQLEPYKDHPEGAWHYQRLELLHRGNSYMRQSLRIELAHLEHNVQVLETGPVGVNTAQGENPFRNPEHDPAFLEARAQSDLYFAGFHLITHGPAIDAIMRVGVNEPVLACPDEASEQACKDRAATLKAAMAGDVALTQLVNRWANDLQETLLLLEWGKSCLQRLAPLAKADKRSSLEDPDWAKLNGKVLFLASLAKQAEGHPALATLFASFLPPAELESVVPAAEAEAQPEAPAEDLFEGVDL